jgi:NAD(P)-dependent dehydrogenase (short-subunit alcohol dehydrogenase family)
LSLEGTTVVVTGASQGLGLATAQGLARQGAALVLVSRDPERARQARAEVSAASGNARIETCLADLSSLASVRELAARLIALPGRLGVLINNAAVATPVRQQTVDGFELQFALNHLAPFLLTNLLRDRLVADAPARVVTVSSRVHAHGAIHFDDLQGTHDYSGARAYNQSKLANVLFTYELARRLAGTGVTANCLHPGVAPTNLNRFLAPNRPPSGGPAPPFALRLRRALHRRLDAWRRGPSRRVMTVEEASRTAIHLASEPDLAGITGAYFVGRRQTRSSAQSYDAALAARLWEVSETLTGLRPAR